MRILSECFGSVLGVFKVLYLHINPETKPVGTRSLCALLPPPPGRRGSRCSRRRSRVGERGRRHVNGGLFVLPKSGSAVTRPARGGWPGPTRPRVRPLSGPLNARSVCLSWGGGMPSRAPEQLLGMTKSRSYCTPLRKTTRSANSFQRDSVE